MVFLDGIFEQVTRSYIGNFNIIKRLFTDIQNDMQASSAVRSVRDCSITIFKFLQIKVWDQIH